MRKWTEISQIVAADVSGICHRPFNRGEPFCLEQNEKTEAENILKFTLQVEREASWLKSKKSEDHC